LAKYRDIKKIANDHAVPPKFIWWNLKCQR